MITLQVFCAIGVIVFAILAMVSFFMRDEIPGLMWAFNAAIWAGLWLTK